MKFGSVAEAFPPAVILSELFTLSDRGPQPAAFAGWGGGAKDLLYLATKMHRSLAALRMTLCERPNFHNKCQRLTTQPL
jgi:hypothetical protein